MLKALTCLIEEHATKSNPIIGVVALCAAGTISQLLTVYNVMGILSFVTMLLMAILAMEVRS